jgi:hypothetical protein
MRMEGVVGELVALFLRGVLKSSWATVQVRKQALYLTEFVPRLWAVDLQEQHPVSPDL